MGNLQAQQNSSQNHQNSQNNQNSHQNFEENNSNTPTQFFAAHQQKSNNNISPKIESSCESSRNTSCDSNGFPRVKTESIDHEEGMSTLEALFAKEAAKHQC